MYSAPKGISKYLILVGTIPRLGLRNLVKVLFYKLSVKLKLSSVIWLKGTVPQGPFFDSPSNSGPGTKDLLDSFQYHLFQWFPVKMHPTPDWHQNHFTQKVFAKDRHWWELDDFDGDKGDIKATWDLSRFHWVVQLSKLAVQGEAQSIDRINSLLTNWFESNPPYFGVNWKCGQEASIRILSLATATLILGQGKNLSQGMTEGLILHLRRIYPTTSYAIAQNNNHGTSEGAALFIGGSWLLKNGQPSGIKWLKKGIHILENRVQKLIDTDGTFSQYSTVYHRFLIDTLVLVEIWRRRLNLDSFSSSFYEKAQLAVSWFVHMIDHESGDMPNIGHNDGTQLLQVSTHDYRDFRPSAELACHIFFKKTLFIVHSPSREQFKWLELKPSAETYQPLSSHNFEKGGFCCFRAGRTFAVLKYPKNRFRPAHADALHVDLWHNGINYLRDSGTFSYAASPEEIDFYSGCPSHNTIQFDDHDQMPRLGRFLFGSWIKTINSVPLHVEDDVWKFAVTTVDHYGCKHKRSVEFSERRLLISDFVRNVSKEITLRWHLPMAKYSVNQNDHVIHNDHIMVKITADGAINEFNLKTTKESRFYHQQTPKKTLEVQIQSPTKVTTEILLH